MKKLSLLSLLLCATMFMWANYSETTENGYTTLTWDFEEFADKTVLGADEVPNEYVYEGLTLVGGAGNSNDYVQKGAGFHMNGTSKSSTRHIKYTPEYDGKLTVSFMSNNKTATDRITAIGTAVTTFRQANVDAGTVPEEVVAYAFCDGYTLKTVEAELMAGTTYYIFFADGGQNIRKLEYKYLSDPESVVLNNYTLRFKTDKNWSEVYANAWNDRESTESGILMTLENGVYTATVQFENPPTYVSFDNGINESQEYEYVEGMTYELLKQEQDFTVHFKTNAEWEKVYAWAWRGETNFCEPWPGQELTLENGVYTYTYHGYDSPINILFNDGHGNKTPEWVFHNGNRYNLTFESGTNNYYLINYPSDDLGWLNHITTVGNVHTDVYGNYRTWVFTDASYIEDNYMKLSTDGGFKAGDKVTIAVAGPSSSDKAELSLLARTGDDSFTEIHRFSGIFNVAEYYLGEAEPVAHSFWLTKDYDYLYLGNPNGDAAYVTKIQVSRPAQNFTAMLKGATAWNANNDWDENSRVDVDLTQTDDYVYTGKLNLTGITGDYQFKLLVNNGQDDIWMGNKEVTLVDKPDWLSTVSSRTTGSNLLLKNSESEYRIYTVTATYDFTNKVWSLKIEGKDLNDAPDILINYPTSKDGISLNGNCYYSTCWDNDVEKPCIYLGDYNDNSYIALTTEGGFKAGDKITIIGENIFDIVLYTLATDNSIEDIMYLLYKHGSYVLKKDYDKLYLRSSSTSIYTIVVERPLETPVIPVYRVSGDFTDGEIELEETVTPMFDDHTCTVKNYVVKFDEGQTSKTITFKAKRTTGDVVEELAEGTYTFMEEGKYVLNFRYSTYNFATYTDEPTIELSASLQNAEIASVKVMGAWDSWTDGLTLTKGEGDVYTGTLDLTETLDNQKFKVVVNDGDGNTFWLGYQNLTINAPEGWIVAAEDNDDNLLLKNAVTGYKSYTVTATWTANLEADAQWTLKIEGLEARPKTDYTVTLKTNIPEEEWPNVYANLWSGEGDNTVEYAGAWPGKEMEYVDDEDGLAVFTYTFSAVRAPAFVIFNDGTKEGSVVGKNQSDSYEYVASQTYELYELELAGDGANSGLIAQYAGKTCNVTLTGRTLYKDGQWNTLCLPFDVADFTNTPLADTKVKALQTTSSLDAAGVLTLNFGADLSSIEAGVPYIVKWESADNIVAPRFRNVTIKKDLAPVVGSGVTFKGIYDAKSFAADDQNTLFMGSANKLYYPQAGASLGAMRALFQVEDAALVRQFVLNFDGETTAIGTTLMDGEKQNGEVYNLNGQRVAQPSKGLYIVNGRKFVMK